jgi:hypothetical protein
VIIQIIMVGLIIAFPGLVSSGLVKEATMDSEKVFQQMQTESQSKDEAGTPPAAPESAGASGAASPAAGQPATEPEVDPMKGLMDSMKKDAEKKP